MTINYLNANYKMVGLSANWVNLAWQTNGDYDSGRIIHDNEDDTYTMLDFAYGDDEELSTREIINGTIEEVCSKL